MYSHSQGVNSMPYFRDTITTGEFVVVARGSSCHAPLELGTSRAINEGWIYHSLLVHSKNLSLYSNNL